MRTIVRVALAFSVFFPFIIAPAATRPVVFGDGSRKSVESPASIERLHRAAATGDVQELRKVVGANRSMLDYRFGSGDTPLTISVSGGHADAALYLLSVGANANVRTRIESTPLHAASYDGNLEIVRALLAYGADPNRSEARYGWTPLISAAMRGHLEVVKALLEAGANVNASIVDGNTALYWARAEKHWDVVTLLEEAGGKARGPTPASR